mmetsp:Transcript_37681/g.83915  ORF Transcript_37681/g.83915 Transcript_37681/m.83915 type:complete len:698 (-) Transcript_37681:961-3054(-)
MSRLAFLLAVAIVCTASTGSLAITPSLQGTRLADGTLYFEMHVTVGRAGPDCFERDAILVNGMFQPKIEVTVNDTVMINVFNKIPAKFPQVASGISIHWHGLSMWDSASWFDGTSYVTQCPIRQGANYTYSFKMDESPGSYFWHDHSTANRANGLQGPLIVHAPPDIPSPFDTPKDEYVVFITDWYHEEANVMAMRVNRPFVADQADNNTGSFVPVGPPPSLLINNLGFYGDCATRGDGVNGENGYVVPVCNVTSLNVTKQQAALITKDDPKTLTSCGHEVFDVEPGEMYMFRLINAGTMLYVTVCFEEHDVTLFTADTTPVDPQDRTCVDINSGQRYDVFLTASSPGRNFWISIHSQYRNMAPSVYGVLHYTDAPEGQLPTTPTPQPGLAPWTEVETAQVMSNDGILGYIDNYDFETWWGLFVHRGLYGDGVLFGKDARTITLNQTQPIITENGMVRWAMNNIAMPTDPPCQPLQLQMMQDPHWMSKNTVNSSVLSDVTAANSKWTANRVSGKAAHVYIDEEPAPLIPATGLHIAEIKSGDIVDVIINNRPYNEGGASDSDRRVGMEQHPIHLHGHKFWVLGVGAGVYNASVHEPLLNRFNPILRDTITLPRASWAVIRFIANNPGIWPLHCHIMWHHFMGQQMYIVEAKEKWAKPPAKLPSCPGKCIYNFAPFTRAYIQRTYGPAKKNKFQLPSK